MSPTLRARRGFSLPEVILSMTLQERAKPGLLNASRRKRIAAGSGTSVQEINKLVKQLEQMQTVMKRMRKMGLGNMMGMMKNMMSGPDAEMLAQSMGQQGMEGLDPEALKSMGLGDMPSGPLGPNPFLPGGKLPPGLGGLLGPLKGKK